MIFGESAGAGSMSNHLTMKKSWGLFSSVTLESGSFGDWVTQPLETAQTNFDRVLEATNCADLACLLSIPTGEILRAGVADPTRMFCPTADGVEIVTHPWIALANGDVADVPVMHGSNSDEGALFTVLPRDATQEQLNATWSLYGYNTAEIETLTSLYVTNKVYPETPRASVYWWAAQRTWGDSYMACPAKYASQQFSKLQLSKSRQSCTFLYHFEHQPRHADFTRHVSEIQYVFHQQELLDHTTDHKMADKMCTMWGNFISLHNPNGDNTNLLQSWKSYDARTDLSFAIREANDMENVAGLKNEECSFFIPRIDTQLRSSFK